MPKQKSPSPKSELAAIELHPDAWKRFEAGIRSLAKKPAAAPAKSARKKPRKKA
jgi:hypothetical protein